MSLSTILLFLVLLSALVIAHEFGHFFAARRAGMKVDEFGLGFPPKLWSWVDKKGTQWSLNLIPLGGFVKIKGENGDSRSTPDAFTSKPLPWRFVVLFGGIFMNLLVAWVLFSLGFATGMPTVVEDGDFGSSAIVSDVGVRVLEVVPKTAAATAGIQPGDSLEAIDGLPVTTAEKARLALAPHADGTPLHLELNHKTLDLTPQYLASAGKPVVGVVLVDTGMVRYPWYLAGWKGLETTGLAIADVSTGLWTTLIDAVTRGHVSAELSGPVGIAVLTGQIAKLGLSHLIQFAAMLSINLAVLNALPIPALDGGRIAFLFLEAIRRKPVSAKVEQTIHAIGFALLLILVVCVTYRDVLGLFK